MSIVTHLQYSVDEYFEAEMASDLRHEFLDGEISTMVGGSRKHNEIQSNLYRILLTELPESDYRVCCGDTRVKNPKANAYLYPDAAVAIGRGEYEAKRLDTLLNPTVIFEVLSESTLRFDRGEKFELYKQIEGLKEYLLISQDRICLEQFTRQATGSWSRDQVTNRDDQLGLSSIPCELSLAAVYQHVDVNGES